MSGTSAPLTVTRTVRPGDDIHATGFAFDVRRDYASGAQAQAFQYMLDRLQALNLIAWARERRRHPHHRVGEVDVACAG